MKYILLVILIILSGSQAFAFNPEDWNANNCNGLPINTTHQTFYSDYMGVDVGYVIRLPTNYTQDSTTQYPVIYFLHGANGNECNYSGSLGNSNASLLTNSYLNDTIIVTPNGGKGLFYVDDTNCQADFACPETMIIQELIPHIDTTYRTIASKEGRAVQGFSMGGMGALYYATKYPHLFGSAAGMSSACYFAEREELSSPSQRGKCDGGYGFPGLKNVIEDSLRSSNVADMVGFQLSHGSTEAGVIRDFHTLLEGILADAGHINTTYPLTGVNHNLLNHSQYSINGEFFSIHTASFHKSFFDSIGGAPPTNTPTQSPVDFTDYLSAIISFGNNINIFDINSIIRAIME